MRRALSAFAVLLFLPASLAAAQDTAQRPAVGVVVTTDSGLSYKFTKLGSGPTPEPGDLMVIHGIGTFPDGKEFWNTRTDGSPYEYTLGVDRVIKGFEEGMKVAREGDRMIITMKPELAYGERGSRDIPPNSTLVFDYEVLAVKHLTVAKLLRDGFANDTVDAAIAHAKATPDLKSYYVSVSSLQSAASAANRKQAGDGEKVYAFAITLMPNAYQLHQSLARAQAMRGANADAIKSYEAALKLNPKKTAAETRDADAATQAIAELRKKDGTWRPVL